MIWLGSILTLVLIVTMWAAYAQHYGLSLDLKLQPVALATLAVNIFIAFFLQFYLGRRVRDSRTEKDLLISNVTEVIQQLRSLSDLVHSCHGARITHEKQTEIKAALRRLINELDNVETVLGTSDC